MSSYGKTFNINDYMDERFIKLTPFIGSFDVKKAQYVINMRSCEASNVQLKDLAEQLYKSVVKSTLNGDNYLSNATQVVFDWNNKIDYESFANVKNLFRSLVNMNNIEAWQKDLVNEVKRIKETKAIHIFNSGGQTHFWVITDTLNFDLVLRYSDVYINYLDKNHEALCDFMVYQEDEVNIKSLPENTNSIYITR